MFRHTHPSIKKSYSPAFWETLHLVGWDYRYFFTFAGIPPTTLQNKLPPPHPPTPHPPTYLPCSPVPAAAEFSVVWAHVESVLFSPQAAEGGSASYNETKIISLFTWSVVSLVSPIQKFIENGVQMGGYSLVALIFILVIPPFPI